MKKLGNYIAASLLAVTPVLLMGNSPLTSQEEQLASEQAAVMKTVHQYVDSLNKGDLPNVIAACAKESSIVDEFPPYQWHGKDTCARWVKELAAYNKANGLTAGFNTLREPERIDVTGDNAYVVVKADYRYTVEGKKGAEIGAMFTVALHKQEDGWKITGWSWSRPKFDFDY